MLSDIMEYQAHLKNIYLKSKIVMMFSEHIINVFSSENIHQKISHDLCNFHSRHYPTISIQSGIYPKYLLHINKTNHDDIINIINEFPSKKARMIIKKETLRLIFLFTLSKYLKFSCYNVDLFAYRTTNFDVIQFTTEYQFFDTLYEIFFNQKTPPIL
jgi:hypothetical protein